MPDVLFYELISSNEPGRSRCFRKLPPETNPIPIAKHVGALLQIELATHKPAGLPSENLVEVDYRFNPGLAEGSYELSEADKAASEEIQEELLSDIAGLSEKAKILSTMFPDIDAGSDAKRAKYRGEIEEFVASDRRELPKFLASLHLPDNTPMPNEDVLGPSWALFRWLQVQLLFAIDFRNRYGVFEMDALTPKQVVKLEHDVLDAHYLVLGVLEQAFATREKKLGRFFQLLCPNGIMGI